MIRMTTRFVLIVALAVFAGCSSSTDSSPNAPPLGGDAGGPGDKVADAMGKLSAEDRAAAEKQKKCPVDDVQLGTMGVPVKVNVKETDAFVCCAACEKKLKENPDQYMSKIK